MDRTELFASKVRLAVGRIVDEWVPDEASFDIVDNLTSLVHFTWPPETGARVTYEVRIIRHGPELREEDLKIEVYRDHGAGMYVPTEDASVRITHTPTGHVGVATHRSALKAKMLALAELREKVFGA